ncbi:tRNA methyltransferase 10 homolog C [Periophthalmus magnuspinnatus]|uniref:tRNA methyltransferase 10 homolog C n=1 Tax=Periophthalmus magnuspinnatus TaxID=409849 RepID=UPI00145BDAD5|nr:tRNA methyltransferase 10 homolog C [Periophthalmus magnuspinnatus]
MLRFLTARDLSLIFKRSVPASSCLAKRQVNRFQRVNFCTTSPSRKDASLPNPRVSDGPETIDLDKWKTVMKSKATPEDKIQVDEGEDEEETEGDMTLEAIRELVSMWRLAGKLVPQEITDEELQTLAELSTKSARKKYLKYLAIREGHKKSRKEKQQKKKAHREALMEKRVEVEGDGQKEPEMKNSLILQFWNRSLDRLLAWRSAQAMVFGQPLIFDLSYEDNMTKQEIENTVSQLMEVEAWNRRAIDPFHLHFCNLQPDSYYKQQLIKRYGEETWDRLFITSTEKQHFEVFPREQLVYLTADSPNVLRTYDHNKVYIVGALVDRSIQKGLSLANAKRLKLATARLPLDEFLHWEMGAKNLTLDQLIRIMLMIKDTGKWEEALQFVPTRKHDGFHPHQRKETKSVTNTSQKIFKSGSNSAKDLMLGNRNIKPTLNRPKTMKAKTGKSKQANRNGNWWDE